MNQQQQTAISNPCEFAEECTNRRYLRQWKETPFTVSVAVTVNVGEE